MVNVRETVEKRLKRLGKSRLWLAQQMKVRPATVYDFLNGNAEAKVETMEKMLSVLGLAIREKDAGESDELPPGR